MTLCEHCGWTHGSRVSSGKIAGWEPGMRCVQCFRVSLGAGPRKPVPFPADDAGTVEWQRWCLDARDGMLDARLERFEALYTGWLKAHKPSQELWASPPESWQSLRDRIRASWQWRQRYGPLGPTTGRTRDEAEEGQADRAAGP